MCTSKLGCTKHSQTGGTTSGLGTTATHKLVSSTHGGEGIREGLIEKRQVDNCALLLAHSCVFVDLTHK